MPEAHPRVQIAECILFEYIFIFAYRNDIQQMFIHGMSNASLKLTPFFIHQVCSSEWVAGIITIVWLWIVPLIVLLPDEYLMYTYTQGQSFMLHRMICFSADRWRLVVLIIYSNTYMYVAYWEMKTHALLFWKIHIFNIGMNAGGNHFEYVTNSKCEKLNWWHHLTLIIHDFLYNSVTHLYNLHWV